MMRCLVSALLLLMIGRSLLAEEVVANDTARQSFQQGVEAFEAGRVSDALILFQRAYSLRPSYRILYNIGQAESELGLTLQAIESFERYLAAGKDELPPERKEAIESELRRMRAMTGMQEVSPAPPPPEAPSDLQMQMTVAPEAPNKFLTVGLPWLTTGLAVASLTGAAVLAGRVSTLNGNLNKQCDSGICPAEYRGDIRTMHRLAVTADVLFVTTAILTTTAVTLFVVAKKKKRADP